MSTRGGTPDGAFGAGTVPASRIVRIGDAAWPAVVGATVLATVALAVPHDAWLPWASGPALPEDWARTAGRPLDWLVRAQVGLGAFLSSAAPVGGAIAVAACLAALAAVALARALRAAGLSASLAALLALVAASAPFAGWQAASPLGPAPVALASSVALLVFVRGRRVSVRGSTPVLAVGLLALAGAALAAATLGVRTTQAMWTLVRGDLEWPGLVLLLAPLARAPHATVAPSSILGVSLVLLVLSAPADGVTRAALVLPWVWWLAGTGLAATLSSRGRHTPRWAALGLMVWVGLHAGRVPWGHQWQQTALVRSWAEGLTPLLAAHSLAPERSARGILLESIVEASASNGVARTPIAADVRSAVADGVDVVVMGGAQRERWRWNGVAFAEVPETTGVGVDRLIDRLPEGTIVLAAISRHAASDLTPAHWQALGRVGLRLIDAGQGRAHVLMGVTRSRVEGLEAAHTGTARLEVVPGDPIGRTGARSPIDARLEADDSHARIVLRGRSVIDTQGLALLFVTKRGDALASRSGVSPAALDGAPLGLDSTAPAMARAALPCVHVQPGRPTDVSGAVTAAALGVTLTGAGGIDVVLTRPAGLTSEPTMVRDTPESPDAPATFSAAADRFRVEGTRATQAGVHLRGPVQRGVATSTAPATLCAAWPPVPLVDPRPRVDVPMAPETEPHLAAGWHAIETMGDGRYFRWMAGPRATLLFSFRTPRPVRFHLDAQSVAQPAPDDVVRLTVNGRDVGARPLLPTRGVYTWDIGADHLTDGLNTVELETTQTLRPAERQAGADGRLLGLAVHGWGLEATPPQR